MSKEIAPQSAHQSLWGSAAGRRATWYDSRLRVMEERSDARSMKTSAAPRGASWQRNWRCISLGAKASTRSLFRSSITFSLTVDTREDDRVCEKSKRGQLLDNSDDQAPGPFREAKIATGAFAFLPLVWL